MVVEERKLARHISGRAGQGRPGQAGEKWKGRDSLGTWQEAPPGRRQDVFACLGYYHFIVFVAWNFLHTKTNKNIIEKFFGQHFALKSDINEQKMRAFSEDKLLTHCPSEVWAAASRSWGPGTPP